MVRSSSELFAIVKCIGCGQLLIINLTGNQTWVRCGRCGTRTAKVTYTGCRKDLLIKTSTDLDSLRAEIPEYHALVGTSKPWWCYETLPATPVSPVSHKSSNLSRDGILLEGLECPLGSAPEEKKPVGKTTDAGKPERTSPIGNERVVGSKMALGGKLKGNAQGIGMAGQESASKAGKLDFCLGERGVPGKGQDDLPGDERNGLKTSREPPTG